MTSIMPSPERGSSKLANTDPPHLLLCSLLCVARHVGLAPSRWEDSCCSSGASRKQRHARWYRARKAFLPMSETSTEGWGRRPVQHLTARRCTMGTRLTHAIRRWQPNNVQWVLWPRAKGMISEAGVQEPSSSVIKKHRRLHATWMLALQRRLNPWYKPWAQWLSSKGNSLRRNSTIKSIVLRGEGGKRQEELSFLNVFATTRCFVYFNTSE